MQNILYYLDAYCPFTGQYGYDQYNFNTLNNIFKKLKFYRNRLELLNYSDDFHEEHCYIFILNSSLGICTHNLIYNIGKFCIGWTFKHAGSNEFTIGYGINKPNIYTNHQGTILDNNDYTHLYAYNFNDHNTSTLSQRLSKFFNNKLLTEPIICGNHICTLNFIYKEE